MLIREAIGGQIRQYRIADGRTIQDIADKTHISTSFVSDMERGSKEMSSEFIGYILRELGLVISISIKRTKDLDS